MKLTKSKLKEIIREEIKKLNEAVGKAELKKMIKMAKQAGARKYDIIKSLASDLSKSEDEVVSDLEKYNLIGMTESKLKKIIKGELVKEGSLYNRASGLVNVKDLYAFVKAGKDMKFELHRKDFGARQIQEFLQELIKKRIL